MTREEAIKLLEHISIAYTPTDAYGDYDDPRPYEEAIDMAIEALQTDAVQGEWIDVDNEPYCECSVCGSYIDNLDDDYAFCPRCGARMKGGDSE